MLLLYRHRVYEIVGNNNSNSVLCVDIKPIYENPKIDYYASDAVPHGVTNNLYTTANCLWRAHV